MRDVREAVRLKENLRAPAHAVRCRERRCRRHSRASRLLKVGLPEAGVRASAVASRAPPSPGVAEAPPSEHCTWRRRAGVSSARRHGPGRLDCLGDMACCNVHAAAAARDWKRLETFAEQAGAHSAPPARCVDELPNAPTRWRRLFAAGLVNLNVSAPLCLAHWTRIARESAHIHMLYSC